jgi:hypothetical protein
MKYNAEQKLFIYDTFVQRSSWRKCRRKFRGMYPGSTVPYKATICNIVTKLRPTASMLDRRKSRTGHVLTEEKFDDIGTRLVANTKRSFRLLVLQYGLEKVQLILIKATKVRA